MRWVHFQINYFQTLLLFIFDFGFFFALFLVCLFFWGGVGVRTLYMYMMRWHNAIKDFFFWKDREKLNSIE